MHLMTDVMAKTCSARERQDNKLHFSWNYMSFYREVPRLGAKRNVGLTYSILAAISFKIVSLGTYTAIHGFFHASKAPWKSFSLMLSNTACDFL
jgi:hypothetical protein